MTIRMLAIVGSPRHGNTELMAQSALEAAAAEGGVDTEIIHLGDLDIHPCKGDYACVTGAKKGRLCPKWEDDMELVYPRMIQADAIILASPVYYATVSAQMKILMDRMQPLKDRGGHYGRDRPFQGALRNKIGGALAVARLRNGGQETTIQTIHNFFHVLDMIPVGTGAAVSCLIGAAGSTWLDPENPTKGVVLDLVKNDLFGLGTAEALARRMLEVTRIVKSGLQAVSSPNREQP
ncbi:MAG: flavodoxin family protein [Thermodesulfobacteriota bacterium]